MKTLFIAAASLALVVTAGSALVGQAHAAAAAKDPMCSVAGQSANQSWADHYGCWGHYAPTKTVAHPPKGPAKDPMCGIPSMSGSQSWAMYYHCW